MRSSAVAALFAGVATAFAAPMPTNIAQTPLIVTSSAQAKPNVMLLMDNSGSMGRTHMPDEAESVMGVKSIGYKSAQCNALYYSPTGTYLLPKTYDGNFFPQPAFNSAPYAGYGAFFTPVPDLSVTNLSSGFVPYDWGKDTVLGPVAAPTSGPSAGFAGATPGAAYYYMYTGPETLKYDSAPCNQLDTGATVATPGGGLWTRVDVSTGTALQQAKFALWYSFYRTRLGLTKSAASLAFLSLDASKRVGFITVEPQLSPNAGAIEANRFLKIDDFATVALGQKEQWYKKLFSQTPGGASPTREGLARVGRYYGGETDGINNGMRGPGSPDPVQYACQQNFTILTTDGYWNGQTESPNGGGIKLNRDASALVGQQDGKPTCDDTDPYCVRPIFDGNLASIEKVTDKNNSYLSSFCPIDIVSRRTEQQQRRVYDLTRNTTRTQQLSVQFKRSSSQLVAASVQTVKTVKQTTRTTDQYYMETLTGTQDRYQVWKSEDRIERTTEQFQRQTRQQTAQTLQNKEEVRQTTALRERWQTASSQYVVKTTQFQTQTINYTEGKEQVYKRQWQWIGTGPGEVSAPLPDPNTCPPGYTCTQYDSFVRALVDPSACAKPPDPAFNTDPTLSYVHTDCTPGPAAVASREVPACSPGVTAGTPDPATSTNGYVKTTCNRVASTPSYSTAYTVASCTAVASSQLATWPYTITTCAVTMNSTVGQSSVCVPEGPKVGPGNVITECTQPAATNYLARNAPPCDEMAGPQTDVNFVTTTCTKLPDDKIPNPPLGAGCSNNNGIGSPFVKITCGSVVVSSTAKPISSCTPTVGPPTAPDYLETKCVQTPTGPTPSVTAVPWGSCSAGPNGGTYTYDTVCSSTGPNNQTSFVDSATCGGTASSTPATGAPWIDTFCTTPAGANNQTVPWDANAGPCPTGSGTSSPFVRATCSTIVVSTPVPVDKMTCASTTTSTTSPFLTTHCVRQSVAGAFTCPGATPSGYPWIYEECGTSPSYANLVGGSCTPNTAIGPNQTCKRDVTTTPVATCSEDLVPSGTNPRVTCSDPTVIAALSGAVDPSSCPARPGQQGGPDFYDVTCATNPAGAYATPAGVQTCPSPAMNPSTFVVTACSYPSMSNFTLVDSAPCDVAADSVAGDGANGWKTTECLKVTTPTDIKGSDCNVIPQTRTGPGVTCVANGGDVAKPVDSCTVGQSDAAAPYDTVTACNSTQGTAPWNNYGTSLCVAGNGSAVGQRIDCRSPQVGFDVVDSSCSPTGPDASGIIVSCPHTTGSGYHYKQTTTTTVYTRRLPSGGPVYAAPAVAGPSDIGDACYTTAQPVPSPTFPDKPPVTIAGCAGWPCTEATSSAVGSVNSLADVAQYYYTTDLRLTMDNVVKPAGTGPYEDTAKHQHMTTFVVALGVDGTLKYRSDYRTAATGDFADIVSGVKDWPVWPDPNLDYTVGPYNAYNNPKSIDDFWHTAVNGRGRFFSANNPTTVINGLAEALAKVDTTTAAGAADAISSLAPTSTNNFVYGSLYESGTWKGDLEAYTIDPVSGVLSARVWSAQGLLDGRTFQTCDNRKIFFMRGNSLVDFAWDTDECSPSGASTGPLVPTAMDPTEQANFSPANISLLSQFTAYLPGDPQLAAAQAPGAIVNFLRGERGAEGFIAGSTSKLFRQRASVLGDLVDSQPVYVKEPFANYADAGYDLFKIATAGRPSMVYVGGNDGMLHAFYATTNLADPLHGQEAWAVIPSEVLPNLYKLADVNYDRNHKFFVDGTPVASDVYNGTWHTILVGGLSAGGKGYYALDITDPTTPTARWEFKHSSVCTAAGPTRVAAGIKSDCNLGLSFGKPVITKLTISPIETKWVVMFTSGYNNLNGAASGDGGGYLYVVDAWDGELLYKIATGAGDAAVPSGLAQINNYVDNVLINNSTLRAYGGDLLGNVWRFEFAPTFRAVLVGTATTGASPQPITTRPELAELNGEPFVLVGTGRLLGDTDVSDSQQQSVYGIRDKLTAVPAGFPPAIYSPPLRNSLRGMTMAQVGNGPTAVRTVSCTANCAKTDGWVVDLPESRERVNVDMKLVMGTLVFASNVPEDIPCSVGGHSWLNEIDFRTGQAVVTAPLSGSNGIISNYLANSLNEGFNVIQRERSASGEPAAGSLNSPSYTDAHQGNGDRLQENNHLGTLPPSGRRISWREIVQ